MTIEKVAFAILKEIDKGNQAYDEETFGVSQEVFTAASRFVVMNNLAKDVLFPDNIADAYEVATLTPEGKAYINENSTWNKAYAVAKEVRDWIKL